MNRLFGELLYPKMAVNTQYRLHLEGKKHDFTTFRLGVGIPLDNPDHSNHRLVEEQMGLPVLWRG